MADKNNPAVPTDPAGGVVPVIPVRYFSPIRSLCCRGYPGHPRGCPNYGKRPSCPPQAKPLHEVLDLNQQVWAIYNRFPIGGHAARMKAKHPDWSERQMYCCLYWQPQARKQLRARIMAWLRDSDIPEGCRRVLTCPEACGCNVTATMAAVGIQLEWPPRTVAYQVALAGVARLKEMEDAD